MASLLLLWSENGEESNTQTPPREERVYEPQPGEATWHAFTLGTLHELHKLLALLGLGFVLDGRGASAASSGSLLESYSLVEEAFGEPLDRTELAS